MANAVETEHVDGDAGTAAAVPSARLAAQIAHRIEETVIAGGWPVGTSLGSEVELRERFGVSRSVLREAVRLVEHHQVARMRRGPNGGLFVSAPDAGPATRATVIYLEYVGTSVADLLEARLLLEPIAAGLAGEQITEEGIALLRGTLDNEAACQGDRGVSAQDPLHPLLGELSGNPVLRLFIDVLTRLTARYAHTSRQVSKAEVAESKRVSHEAHMSIVDAVIASDAAIAQMALIAHLEAIAAWIEAHRVRHRTRIPGPVVEPEIVEGPQAKLAEVLASRIHDDIVARGWQVGMVLGSESDLLARYGISRSVLREAVRLLEYHSVARMRRGPGGGLVIATPEPQASIDTMALFLEYQGVTTDNLRVVRNAIELGVVVRATARHAQGDTGIAERLRATTQLTADGPEDYVHKADSFHTELADSAGNPVLSLFLAIITELFRRHTAEYSRPAPGETAAAEVRHAHERILDAVLAGDSGLARHRMRRHLDALAPWWA
ncbi:FadR family transcriptional regulator [Nocardia uniformis]|uniref:FadR family transcriptional regulator n=1 Tax=Nocardia uniformis TaxID=53432 RepID=A0A849C357_9NOCA|nr:FCD domain-containing protein [Nocardia uniformis]NNH70870.1 FadR family transcriptional regulator [Nocardia uniformis]